MDLQEVFFTAEDLISPGLSACPGCAGELSLRTAMKIMGKNTVLGVPPGCMAGAGVVGWNRLAGAKVPITIPLLDNTASMMAGVRRHYQSIGRDDVKVVAFAGDGATADAGFQSLSGVAERGENIIYICYDNEGYMNTGFQRSSTSTKGSNTSTTPIGKVRKGKAQHKKDLPLLLAMHDAAYVATASPAYMQDFVRKIEKAKTVTNGMVYIHVLSPCSTGWHFDPKDTIAIARLAVQTNFFPLWEYESSTFRQTVSVKNAKPVQQFIAQLGKFRHLSEREISELQIWVDEKMSLLNRLFAAVTS
jgi:pyruvate/2-oxoacid:ferredoxin oxidoreductase beta subunit